MTLTLIVRLFHTPMQGGCPLLELQLASKCYLFTKLYNGHLQSIEIRLFIFTLSYGT